MYRLHMSPDICHFWTAWEIGFAHNFVGITYGVYVISDERNMEGMIA